MPIRKRYISNTKSSAEMIVLDEASPKNVLPKTNQTRFLLKYTIKQTLRSINGPRWNIRMLNKHNIDHFPFTNINIEHFVNKLFLAQKTFNANDTVDLLNYELIYKKFHNTRYYIVDYVINNNRYHDEIEYNRFIDDMFAYLDSLGDALDIDKILSIKSKFDLRFKCDNDTCDPMRCYCELLLKNYDESDDDRLSEIIDFLKIVRFDKLLPSFPKIGAINSIKKFKEYIISYNVNSKSTSSTSDVILYVFTDMYSMATLSEDTMISKKTKKRRNDRSDDDNAVIEMSGRCVKYISNDNTFYRDSNVFVMNMEDLTPLPTNVSRLNILQFNVNKIYDIDTLLIMLNRYMGITLGWQNLVCCFQEVGFLNLHQSLNRFRFKYVWCDLSHPPSNYYYISGKKKNNISQFEAREAVIPFEYLKRLSSSKNDKKKRRDNDWHFDSYNTPLTIDYDGFKRLMPRHRASNHMFPSRTINAVERSVLYNEYTDTFEGKLSDKITYDTSKILDSDTLDRINRICSIIYKLTGIDTGKSFVTDRAKNDLYQTLLKERSELLTQFKKPRYGDAFLLYFIDCVTDDFQDFERAIREGRYSLLNPNFVELLKTIPLNEIQFYEFTNYLFQLFSKWIPERYVGTDDKYMYIIDLLQGHIASSRPNKKLKVGGEYLNLQAFDQAWQDNYIHKLFISSLKDTWRSNNNFESDSKVYDLRHKADVMKFFVNENPYVDQKLKNKHKADTTRYTDFLGPRRKNKGKGEVDIEYYSLIERIHYSLMTLPNVRFYNTLERRARIIINHLGTEDKIITKSNVYDQNESLKAFYNKNVFKHNDVESKSEWWYVYCNSRVNYSTIGTNKDLMIIFPESFLDINDQAMDSHIFLGLLNESVNISANRDTHAFLSIKSTDQKTAIVNVHLESGSSDNAEAKSSEELMVLMRVIDRNHFFDPCEDIYILGDFNLNSKVIAKTLRNIERINQRRGLDNQSTYKIVLNGFITYEGLGDGNCIDNCIHISRKRDSDIKAYIGFNRTNIIDRFKQMPNMPAPFMTKSNRAKNLEQFLIKERQTAPLALTDKKKKQDDKTKKQKLDRRHIEEFATTFFSDHSPVLFMID